MKINVSKTSLGLSALLMLAPLAPHTAIAAQKSPKTKTPIGHVVVIFQENVSFDHYFATYPAAENPPGEPQFNPSPDTPSVNGLTNGLILDNPNSTLPFRLDRSQAATCDQNHDYTPEQQAFNAGLMNKFVEFTGTGGSCDPRVVMGYYDGNTVTALWNYAQHFAMSDNSFDTTFGPSSPGHINLISGQTHGAVDGGTGSISGDVVVAPDGSLTMIGDPQPFYDDCSTRETVKMTGKNIGDLLNTKGITWGWFQGGFTPSSVDSGKAKCATSHVGSDGNPKGDYIPHHEPFQYYQSTSNPHHLPPSSVAMIGKTDQANHQYDLTDFWNAAAAGNIPAVTFLKARGFQDGHAGYSDPLAEQSFVVDTLNRLQQLPQWKDMAVIIAWDDSDGWYDHVMGPIVSESNSTEDALTGPGSCGSAPSGAYQGRCGYGPRQPLLVVSPFAKTNFVDHSVTDLSSILQLIEDNWQTGRIGDQSFDEKAGSLLSMFDFHAPDAKQLFLDPATGVPTHGRSARGD
jgi:phospholipase C